MKNQLKAPLIALMVVTIGFTGFSVLNISGEESNQSGTYASGAILGHVTAIQSDADGNVIYYSQGDNLVVDEGENCAPVLLFGEAASAITDCPDTFDKPFDSVCVFADTIATESIVATSGASDTLSKCLRTDGLDFVTPSNGTNHSITVTESANGSPATSSTDIAYQYTGGAGANQPVASAALWETDGDALFAATDFSGGSITLQESDTLDVTWTITFGG